MQPWKVSLGLTIAVLASLALLATTRFDYLQPFRVVIITEYWWPILLYGGSAVLVIVITLAGILRTLGLYDLGRKTGFVERSLRRGDGDPDLARRLADEAEGRYPD